MKSPVVTYLFIDGIIFMCRQNNPLKKFWHDLRFTSIADILFHLLKTISMKKIYLLLGLISSQSFSQDFAKSNTNYTGINLTTQKNAIVESVPTTVLMKKNGEYVKAYLNNIPSSVMADFAKRYDEIDGVTWKIDDNDITGYFNNNGQKTVVSYKKNGQLVSTRKTHDGSALSKSIRSFIQSDINKGFTINMVTEVVGELVTLYEVNLVDQQQIHIVRISRNKDAEPEVTERISYTKIPVTSL